MLPSARFGLYASATSTRNICQPLWISACDSWRTGADRPQHFDTLPQTRLTQNSTVVAVWLAPPSSSSTRALSADGQPEANRVRLEYLCYVWSELHFTCQYTPHRVFASAKYASSLPHGRWARPRALAGMCVQSGRLQSLHDLHVWNWFPVPRLHPSGDNCAAREYVTRGCLGDPLRVANMAWHRRVALPMGIAVRATLRRYSFLVPEPTHQPSRVA